MPQTNPFHSLVPRKMTDPELARAIRLDIEAELDAINLYQAHIDATDNAEAIRIISHVMNEEKEHAALFWRLLQLLDPKQNEENADSAEKLRLLLSGASDEEVELAGKGGGGSDEGAAEEAREARPQLTIGSLKKTGR
jgi:rubrerythrin